MNARLQKTENDRRAPPPAPESPSNVQLNPTETVKHSQQAVTTHTTASVSAPIQSQQPQRENGATHGMQAVPAGTPGARAIRTHTQQLDT